MAGATPRARRSYAYSRLTGSARTPRRDTLDNVTSVLRNCRSLRHAHEQHLHVWAYIPYRRWLATIPREQFSQDCLPPYEGWHACWIRPIAPRHVGGIGAPVLELDLVYHDGSAQRAYATRDGELIAVGPATAPRDGVFVDAVHTILQMDVVSTARSLTLADIRTRRRGVVHGSVCAANNARCVSHVVSMDGNECVLQRIPITYNSAPETATATRAAVRHYAPELLREYEYRTQTKLTRGASIAMLPYMDSLLQRAMNEDICAREAYSPRDAAREAEQSIADEVRQGLISIQCVMTRQDEMHPR